MKTISPAALRRAIDTGGELAILDAREEGSFGSGHLFWAVPCPWSRREIDARRLLPGKDARVVVTDEAGEIAPRLAAWLEADGYSDVAVLEGGSRAWAEDGYVVFTGVNVPSKAFGEWVEHHYGTESIDPAELDAWLRDGRDMVVLDSRPFDEFHRMSIPTGMNVPGGELAYRIADLVPDPATTIVVNCAGRTRSILGAESLRRAGVANRVVALRNGTMGWELAGFTAERGATRRFSVGRPASAATALERATAFAEASGVRVIDAAALARFEGDASRTCYRLDVRDPAEYQAGHRPGSVNAPGGQLVQATDRWIATRGARICLLDDDGVRARMAAAWLRQMGHGEVYVVARGIAPGRDPAPIPELRHAHRETTEITAGDTVIDLARSVDFRDGHIPGARWGLRGRLERLAPLLRAATRVVLTSPDGVVARLAVAEVEALTEAPVVVLQGGTRAWQGPRDANRFDPADADCIDTYLRPYDRNDGVEAAMREYLSWEIDLMAEIARDGTARFGVAAAAA